jgi:hypothetical protein
LDLTKTIWTVQNHFGPIEGQGIINIKSQKQKNLTQNSGTNKRNENIGHNIGAVTQDHFAV